jgi:hypothetical protein
VLILNVDKVVCFHAVLQVFILKRLEGDGHPTYAIIAQRKWVGGHNVIEHTRHYAMGDVHTNTIENAFSLLKRGVYGTSHKVSIKHLGLLQ